MVGAIHSFSISRLHHGIPDSCRYAAATATMWIGRMQLSVLGLVKIIVFEAVCVVSSHLRRHYYVAHISVIIQ